MKAFKILRAAAILLLCCMFAAGCYGAPGPMPTEEPTEAATQAPTQAPTEAPTEEPTPEPTLSPEARLIRDKMDGMTVREKIGQLVMFAVPGTSETVPSAYLELIDEYSVGNIIVVTGNFDKNDGSGGFDSAAAFVRALDSHAAPLPRLYAADVEGGSVVRFSWEPKLPSARELANWDEGDIKELFRSSAEKLRSCGINLDLAPVSDVAEDSPVLGTRVFSGDCEKTARCCRAVIEGLREGGCASCLKHFPGHGAADVDSHEKTPVIWNSAQELYENDIEAFRLALAAEPDCVMTAHVLYPAIDEGDIASMSQTIILNILRGELGFEGVVISDDMLMGGLKESFPIEEAPVKFILCGGDIVLCGADIESQRTVLEALLRAYELRIITEERLDESVYRILKLKLDLRVWQP